MLSTERCFGSPEIVGDEIDEIHEQVDQFGCDPLLDRGVYDLLTGEQVVEIVNGRDRATSRVVSIKNI